MSMPIPRVKFIEINSGFTPIRTSAKNRIGIVAPFSRGPAFRWRYVGGYTDFADTWGSDTSIGSLAFQSSWDQGARDFGIIRVLGAGAPAQGIVRFGGVSSKHNTILLHLRVIGDPIRRSDKDIKANIFSSGEYRSSISGRYWFRVDSQYPEDGVDKFRIKWIFVPLGADGVIAWQDTAAPDVNIPLDPIPTEYTDAAIQATTDVSGITPTLMTIIGSQEVVFPDSCLSLPSAGEACTQVNTPGYVVVVNVGDMRWYWHIESANINNIRINEEESGYFGTPPVPLEGFPEGLTSELVTDTRTGFTNYLNLLYTESELSNVEVYTPTESIVVPEDQTGIVFSIDRGLTLQFETLNSVDPIYLEVGDMWSVRVNSDTWRIPISEGATPNQVATSMIEVLAGDDPLGEITRTREDDGIIFKLMEEETGVQGNKYTYYVDLETPDGEVITEATYVGADVDPGTGLYPPMEVSSVQVPIVFAHHIQNGATVSNLHAGDPFSIHVVSSGSGFMLPELDENITIPPGTTVASIDIPSFSAAGSGALAVVNLSNPITVVGSGQSVFHFDNTNAGVAVGAGGLGLTMSNYTFYQTRYMSGGINGPRMAFRDFYSIDGHKLLTLIATSEGQWGNSLRVTIYPLTTETFNLRIVDLNSDSYDPPIAEEYYANLSFRDVDERGFLNQLSQSKFIRGIFVPKALNPNVSQIFYQKSIMRLAPPDPLEQDPSEPGHLLNYGPKCLRQVHLEDGFDGPPLTDVDYIRAIRIMKNVPANIIMAPGVYQSDVIKHSLVAQAESATELEGLRIAVVNSRPFLAPEAANLETIGYGSNKAVMVAGWGTYIGINNTGRFTLSPDSPYSGKLSRIPFFISPAARTDAGPIYGISELDTQKYNSSSQLQAYTDARLEVLHLDPNLSAFYVLSGRSLTSNTQWDKISYRRTFDIIRADLYVLLQQFKSAPLNQRLFSQISASIDAHLSTMTRNGSLRSYSGTTVRSLNPASGLVEIHVGIVPVYAADYLDVYLYRDDGGNISRPES